MSNKNNYVLLNYDELNEKGLSKLVKEISKGGYKIARVIPASNGRKKDGIMTRTFTLIGIDEQTMEVQVNDTGDISGIKLNGKNSTVQASKNNVGFGAISCGFI
ncbi:Uncharacterised protein [Escherichia coli]|uniref:Defence against restriction A N-terminal domain-containing protein n=1 Tax=Escherichia coli TaxID=562 RepID=A0AAX2KK01_ECOLX|nr:Uncharacterised protein [Escherichia coli]